MLSACSNISEFSGETFDIREAGDPNSPGSFQTIASLEFTDGNTFKNTKGNEEGTYELSEDKLVILMEDGNEKVEIEFTLEESGNGLSEYSAELTDADYQMKDTEQVSKYREFYQKIRNANSYVVFGQN